MVRACDRCRKQKLKCDGQHPCARCLKLNHVDECIYTERGRPGRPKRKRVEVPNGVNVAIDAIVATEGSLLKNKDPFRTVLRLVGMDEATARELLEHSADHMFRGGERCFVPCSEAGCMGMLPKGFDILDHSSHRVPEACALFLCSSLLYAARSMPFVGAVTRSASPQAYHKGSPLFESRQTETIERLTKVCQTLANHLSTLFDDAQITAQTLSDFLQHLVGFKQRLANHYISVVCHLLSDSVDSLSSTEEHVAFLRLRQAHLLLNRQPFATWPRKRHDMLEGLMHSLSSEQANPVKSMVDEGGLIWNHITAAMRLKQAFNDLYADLYHSTATLDPTRLRLTAAQGQRALDLIERDDLTWQAVQAKYPDCNVFPRTFQVPLLKCYRATIYYGLGMKDMIGGVVEEVWASIRDLKSFLPSSQLKPFVSAVDIFHFLICAFCDSGRTTTAAEVLAQQALMVAAFPEAQIIFDDDIRALAESTAPLNLGLNPTPAAAAAAATTTTAAASAAAHTHGTQEQDYAYVINAAAASSSCSRAHDTQSSSCKASLHVPGSSVGSDSGMSPGNWDPSPGSVLMGLGDELSKPAFDPLTAAHIAAMSSSSSASPDDDILLTTTTATDGDDGGVGETGLVGLDLSSWATVPDPFATAVVAPPAAGTPDDPTHGNESEDSGSSHGKGGGAWFRKELADPSPSPSPQQQQQQQHAHQGVEGGGERERNKTELGDLEPFNEALYRVSVEASSMRVPYHASVPSIDAL